MCISVFVYMLDAIYLWCFIYKMEGKEEEEEKKEIYGDNGKHTLA